jgi:hypothetical protein
MTHKSKQTKEHPLRLLKDSVVKNIVDKMEGPDIFISFLTEAIGWVSQCDSLDAIKKRDAIFLLTLCINEIAHPWAFNKERTPEHSVGLGVDWMFDYFDYEAYESAMSNILTAFAHTLTQGTPRIDLYQQYMEGINVLMEAGFTLYFLIRNEKRNEKKN